MIILNPFATKLLTSQGNKNLDVHALRFGFYSLLQALASVVLLVMLRHMVSHDQAPGIPEPVMIGNAWQTYGLLVGFGLSIPVFFVTPTGGSSGSSARCWCTGCTGSVTANSDTHRRLPVAAAAINGHTTRRLPELLLGLAVPLVIIVFMLKFSKSYPDLVVHEQAKALPVTEAAETAGKGAATAEARQKRMLRYPGCRGPRRYRPTPTA